MKKASNILLKIAHIFSLVMGILLLISFVPMICVAFLPQVRESFIQVFVNNGVDFGDDPEIAATVAQILMISYALIFVFLGAMCIVNAAICKNTINAPTKGRYIACIILGAMSTDISVIGGILGLIALSKENNQQKLE